MEIIDKMVSLRKQKSASRFKIAPLVDVHGDLAVTAAQKAKALNSQLSSVFTMDDGNLPDFSQRSRDNLSDINLSTERVRKFICMLPNKYSRSPDGIPSAVLKVLSYELCTPLYILFKMSIDSGTYVPCYGKKSRYNSNIQKKRCITGFKVSSNKHIANNVPFI